MFFALLEEKIGLLECIDSEEITTPLDSKYIFPVTLFNGKKRKANAEWFKEREWLHYDKIKDRIFCFVCRNAMERKILITKKFETSLVSEGFKDWQDALRAFRSHEKSQIHLEAVEKKMQQGGKNISDMFTHGTLKQKEKEENFQNLVKIFKVLRHLTRQGQAIRGRTEGESNFHQTLKLLADYNEELKEWLEKKSLRFISPIIENEICQITQWDWKSFFMHNKCKSSHGHRSIYYGLLSFIMHKVSFYKLYS